MEKRLGKIKKVKFGHCGYQELCLGISFDFGGDNWEIGYTKSAWDSNLVPHNEYCKWSEQDREREYSAIMYYISDLLRDAKVDSVDKLIGKPVEVTIDNQALVSWRILTEVL